MKMKKAMVSRFLSANTITLLYIRNQIDLLFLGKE